MHVHLVDLPDELALELICAPHARVSTECDFGVAVARMRVPLCWKLGFVGVAAMVLS